jgi:hypothetical protein
MERPFPVRSKGPLRVTASQGCSARWAGVGRSLVDKDGNTDDEAGT